MTQPLPIASREPRRRSSLAWFLPLVALALSAFLLSRGFVERGPVIEVRAVNGHGIRAGDSLRHLGITVGTIEEVRLGPTLDHIALSIRLAPEAGAIAREGSRFWIVRPHLALDSISGLETVIGARYLAVVPGPEGGARRDEFVALVDPPIEEDIEPGGVEVVLEAPARFGLRPGAPIEYREVRVGTILAVGLASDASSVEARAYIRPPFVELVRDGTRFWESGGFELELGLTTGLKVGLESLSSMLIGAVRFATPPNAGNVVRTGHRFALADEPEEGWLTWRPNVAVGSTLLARGTPMPELVRARLAWREGRLLKRKKERNGWLVRTADGLLGPLDLLRIPDDALDGEARLEVGGVEYPLSTSPVATALSGQLGTLGVAAADRGATLETRALVEPEDVIVARESTLESLALDAARFTRNEPVGDTEGAPSFTVDRDAGLDVGWHGAVVLARSDGKAVGILCVVKDQVTLASLP
ncbi:MAG: MlaD family protein [Planctomycetota bacterium]